jgi:hypothetical protein
MIRAPLGDQVYWDSRVKKFQTAIDSDLLLLNVPSKNPVYAPQFWFDHSKNTFRLMALRYSRGDAVPELSQYFAGLVSAWELSNRLADEVCKEYNMATCRDSDWTFELTNLNYYNWCFWLVGLALTLNISVDQWNRLIALIDSEGQDELLDRVIATRQKGRVIGKRLLHPKPYARLLKATNASPDQRPQLLLEFVEHWYPELARKGRNEIWWYSFGDAVKHPLEMGSYFGRWCIEAAVVAKVFDIDDTLCLGNENYPGDLLRPESSRSKAKLPETKRGFLTKLFGKVN